MIIKSIQAKNHLLGWELEEIQFDTNPTLLVGLSGVGKTQILDAIYNLKNIIYGYTRTGFEWKVVFSINEIVYIWQGRFSEGMGDSEIENSNFQEGIILFENLREINSDIYLFERNKEEIKFNGTTLPKLSDEQSLIYLLVRNEYINNIAYEFNKILLNDYTKKEIGEINIKNSLQNLIQEYNETTTIKNSNRQILIKLLLVSELKLEVFSIIKERILETFPQLEDIILNYYHSPTMDMLTVSISIKEKGVPREIEAKYISSGMLRTIIHIAQIYLANDGSVILIDEFENSLGTNCMDILTEDLIHENKNIQFIATSHHPYIINALPYQYWKIVTRKAGVISAKNASEYKLGKSKQKAFIQLTELLENQY